MKRMVREVLLTSLLMSVAPVSNAAAGDRVFWWCSQSTPELKEYYSTVFRVNSASVSGAIEYRFGSYVRAFFNVPTMSNAVCRGPFKTYGRAEETLTEGIGETKRRKDWDAVLTRWAYSGD